MTNMEFRVVLRDLLQQAKASDLMPDSLSDIIDSEFGNLFPNALLPKTTHPCPPESDAGQIMDSLNEIAHEINYAARVIAYGMMRREMSPQTIMHELDRIPRGKEG